MGQLNCRLQVPSALLNRTAGLAGNWQAGDRVADLKPQNLWANMSKIFNASSASSFYAAYTAVFPVANATGESLFSYAFRM